MRKQKEKAQRHPAYSSKLLGSLKLPILALHITLFGGKDDPVEMPADDENIGDTSEKKK